MSMSIMTVTTERTGVFGNAPITRLCVRFGMIMAMGQADMLMAALANPAAEGDAFRQVLGL